MERMGWSRWGFEGSLIWEHWLVRVAAEIQDVWLMAAVLLRL